MSTPDEVVAIGAAIQAGILTQEVKDHSATRCHAAVFGLRDDWRRDEEADPSQYNHSGSPL